MLAAFDGGTRSRSLGSTGCGQPCSSGLPSIQTARRTRTGPRRTTERNWSTGAPLRSPGAPPSKTHPPGFRGWRLIDYGTPLTSTCASATPTTSPRRQSRRRWRAPTDPARVRRLVPRRCTPQHIRVHGHPLMVCLRGAIAVQTAIGFWRVKSLPIPRAVRGSWLAGVGLVLAVAAIGLAVSSGVQAKHCPSQIGCPHHDTWIMTCAVAFDHEVVALAGD
jgi:hypothetical protein